MPSKKSTLINFERVSHPCGCMNCSDGIIEFCKLHANAQDMFYEFKELVKFADAYMQDSDPAGHIRNCLALIAKIEGRK